MVLKSEDGVELSLTDAVPFFTLKPKPDGCKS